MKEKSTTKKTVSKEIVEIALKRLEIDMLLDETLKGLDRSEKDPEVCSKKKAEITEIFNDTLELYEKCHKSFDYEKNIIAVNMIIDRLGKSLPLTALTKKTAEFKKLEDNFYRSARYPSLYMTYINRRPRYTDTERYKVIDVNSNKKEYIKNRIANYILDIIDPIKMPYFPNTNPYIIYLNFDENDKNKVHIIAIKTPYEKIVNINKWFYENEAGHIEEIEIKGGSK